jgi:hypothetical protein
MQRNWKNRDSTKQLPRIEIIRDSLNSQINKLAALNTSDGKPSRTIDLFCLGMGFKRPMYWSDMEITYGYERELNNDRVERTDVGVICDILALNELIPTKRDIEQLESAINKHWNVYAQRLISHIKLQDSVYEELQSYIESALYESAYDKLHRGILYKLYTRLRSCTFCEDYRFGRWIYARLSQYIGLREAQISSVSKKASIRHFKSIEAKSREIFDSNSKYYIEFIRESLNDFVLTQTKVILRLLTMGHSIESILDYFDETRVESLARQIYSYLDDEVRNSIKVVWMLNKGRLFTAAKTIKGKLDQKQVHTLTEKCVQRYSWSILKPFVRDVVRDLFFESFQESARDQLPYWIGLAARREVIRSLKKVGRMLPDALTQDVYSEEFMFGATPIGEAIDIASIRFLDDIYKRREKILIIISDGEFDTNVPVVSAQLLQRAGVTVVSCCVTEGNVITKLRSKSLKGWPEGVRRLFEMASTVNCQERWIKSIKEKGYEVPEGRKLFYQLNHSEILEDVLRAALLA